MRHKDGFPLIKHKIMHFQVNSFVGAFHDAVILYALALNQTLAEGGNATDGKAITRNMWNRTFQGKHSVIC